MSNQLASDGDYPGNEVPGSIVLAVRDADSAIFIAVEPLSVFVLMYLSVHSNLTLHEVLLTRWAAHQTSTTHGRHPPVR